MLAENLAQRAQDLYVRNPTFRVKMRSRAGRDLLYAYMRHWLAATLNKRYPAVYRILPPGFSVGEPIRKP